MSARLTSEESGPAAPAHTPGPWRAGFSNSGYVIFNTEGWTVANLPPTGNQGLAARRQADAYLILAAPDLLALAKQYASECSGCDGKGTWMGPDLHTEPCPDCADIRQVINKAEGRV